MLYNEKATQEKNSTPIMQEYLKWCDFLQIRTSRILHPAYFGQSGLLRGITTLEDLEPHHTVVSIPIRSTHILSKGESIPVLQKAFASNPAIFCPKRCSIADMNRYLLYLVYDFLRGQEAEYYEYFKISDDPGAIWIQGEYYDLIYDRRLKEEIDEMRDRIDNLWTIFSKILEEIPELAGKKKSKDEFYYCFYFTWSRPFRCHLPSIISAPALDMMNHDDEENHFCRTIINVALENASDEECAKLKYEKKCRSGDLTTLFPEIKEKPEPSLTPALKFFRAAGGVVQDPSRVSLSEEKQLANDKGLELLKSMPRLQVWNLPNWTGLREEVCPEPQDIIEDEGEFEDQLVQFREILQNPEGFKQTPKSQVDFIPKRAGAQFYNPNDLNPENYPWFSHEDTNNFAVMYSITGKVVSAGQQPFLHYGRNTNRFLLKNLRLHTQKEHLRFSRFLSATTRAGCFSLEDRPHLRQLHPTRNRLVT